eukprot:g17193.t1
MRHDFSLSFSNGGFRFPPLLGFFVFLLLHFLPPQCGAAVSLQTSSSDEGAGAFELAGSSAEEQDDLDLAAQFDRLGLHGHGPDQIARRQAATSSGIATRTSPTTTLSSTRTSSSANPNPKNFGSEVSDELQQRLQKQRVKESGNFFSLDLADCEAEISARRDVQEETSAAGGEIEPELKALLARQRAKEAGDIEVAPQFLEPQGASPSGEGGGSLLGEQETPELRSLLERRRARAEDGEQRAQVQMKQTPPTTTSDETSSELRRLLLKQRAKQEQGQQLKRSAGEEVEVAAGVAEGVRDEAEPPSSLAARPRAGAAASAAPAPNKLEDFDLSSALQQVTSSYDPYAYEWLVDVDPSFVDDVSNRLTKLKALEKVWEADVATNGGPGVTERILWALAEWRCSELLRRVKDIEALRKGFSTEGNYN